MHGVGSVDSSTNHHVREAHPPLGGRNSPERSSFISSSHSLLQLLRHKEFQPPKDLPPQIIIGAVQPPLQPPPGSQPQEAPAAAQAQQYHYQYPQGAEYQQADQTYDQYHHQQYQQQQQQQVQEGQGSGDGSGSPGGEGQYYSDDAQMQAAANGLVCSECQQHTWDIPAGHFAAASGHLNCIWSVYSSNPYALLTFDQANRSPLFYACANDRADCCEFLVDHLPPLINLGDVNGDTPLHAAASCGSESCVQLLIIKGSAQVDAANRVDMTAAHLAKTSEVLHALFDGGANMSARDKHGRCVPGTRGSGLCSAVIQEEVGPDPPSLPTGRRSSWHAP
jgi:hypothetical protein